MPAKEYGTVFNVKHAHAFDFALPQGVNVIFMAYSFRKKAMEIVMKKIIRYRYNVSG